MSEMVYLLPPILGVMRPVSAAPVLVPILDMENLASFDKLAGSHQALKPDMECLVEQPLATFYLSVTDDSMTGAGIFKDDLLIVDRILKPQNGSIVMAMVDGVFLIRRLEKCPNSYHLVPENPNYRRIVITEYKGLLVWGVVTKVIHTILRP